MPDYTAQELSVNDYVVKPKRVIGILYTEGNQRKVMEWLERLQQIETAELFDGYIWVKEKGYEPMYALILGEYVFVDEYGDFCVAKPREFHERYTSIPYPAEIEPIGTEDGAWYSPGVINFKGVDFYSDGSDK